MTTQIKSFEEYKKLYNESVSSPEKFWKVQADKFIWKKKWNNIYSNY